MHMFLYFLILYSALVVAEVEMSYNGENVTRALEETGKLYAAKKGQMVKVDQNFSKEVHINPQMKGTEARPLSELNKVFSTDTENDDEGDDDDDDDDSEADDLLETLTYLFSELQNNEKDIRDNLMYADRDRSRSCQVPIQKLNFTRATDLQITRKLTIEFKNIWRNQETISNDVILSILICLEYLVYDFKNANEFNKLKGVSDIILPMLNCTQPVLRVEATHLLASAAQSSPKVQMTALRSGANSVVLKAILQDADPDVQIHSIYTLQYLIRNFPIAQATFVKNGGLFTLAQLFEKEPVNRRMLIKVITMLHDLLLEHKHAIQSYPELDARVKNIYKAVGLERTLLKNGWCSRIFRVLLDQVQNSNSNIQENNFISAVADLSVKNKHDYMDEEYNLPLVDICHNAFNIKNLEEKWFELLLL